MPEDLLFMKEALALAEQAAALGEVPVGAVVVKDGKIIASGFNRRETGPSATAHAELSAIEEACRVLQRWRLSDCTLYVTLEPCPMCAGAIINARLKRVVYGAKDEKAGACGSVVDLFEMGFNHRPVLKSGVLAEECGALLSRFFQALRSAGKCPLTVREPSKLV